MLLVYTTRQTYQANTKGKKEQELLEFSPEGVLLLSEDCATVKFWNASARKLLGSPQVTPGTSTSDGWKLSRCTVRKFIPVDLGQAQVVQEAYQDGTPLEELLQTIGPPLSDGQFSAALHFSMEQGERYVAIFQRQVEMEGQQLRVV